MKKPTLLVLLISLACIPGLVWAVEIYSIQAANFKKIKKAEQQCQVLRKKIAQVRKETWRIEKTGSRYAVRIGQFNQEKPALELLTRIKQTVPDAFLWKGELKKALIVKTYKAAVHRQKGSKPETPDTISSKTPAREYPAPNGKIAQENKKNRVENPLKIGRAVLWGTILETSTLPGYSLGLAAEKEIYRLKVRVDKTEAMQDFSNFLEDKEKEELTLFSEVHLPFFIPEQKIKGVVEYKGDKYKRFYWIKQVESMKPRDS